MRENREGLCFYGADNYRTTTKYCCRSTTVIIAEFQKVPSTRIEQFDLIGEITSTKTSSKSLFWRLNKEKLSGTGWGWEEKVLREGRWPVVKDRMELSRS